MNAPLEHDDKTIFAPAIPQATAPLRNVSPSLQVVQVDYRSGLNPLMEHATEIFLLHYQIIKGHFREADSIRALAQDALLKFELRAQQGYVAKTVIKSTKYVLCTFLDEAVMQQFGHESSWGQRTLLAQFFNETWGGTTVFKIRQFCVENIHEYADLLELIYVCLCLGFKGQYGSLAQGEVQLERLKRESYQAIIGFRGDRSNEPLSPQGVSRYSGGVTLKKSTYWHWLLAGCLGFLLVSYISLILFLNIESGPAYDKVTAALSQPT